MATCKICKNVWSPWVEGDYICIKCTRKRRRGDSLKTEKEISDEIETMGRVLDKLEDHGYDEAASLLNGAIFWLEWVIGYED